MAETTALQSRVTELQASQADFDRRLQMEAAKIVASTGTTVPARVTAAGDVNAVPQDATLADLVARYDRLVGERKPEEAADFFNKHLARHFIR